MKSQRQKLLKAAKLQTPNILLYAGHKKMLESTKIGKISYFIHTEATQFIDSMIPLRFKVIYGKDVDGSRVTNEMICNTMSDLKWAFNAFTDRKLYLQKLI